MVDTNLAAKASEDKLLSQGYVLTFISTLSLYVGIFLVVIATPLYAKHFGASALEIGIIMSSFNVACVATRFVAGRIIDTRGQKLIMIFGAVILIITAILFNLSNTVLMLTAVRFLQGIGLPAFSSAASTYIAEISPPRRRGEALGYYNITWGITQGLAPPLSIALIFSSGFTSVFLITAVVTFVALLLILPVKERRAEKLPHEAIEKPLVVHPKAVFPAVIWFCQGMAMASINFFLPLYALESKVGNPGLFFTIFALVSIPVSAFAGRLSDRYGRAPLIVPGLILSSTAMVLLAFAPSPSWFLVAALFLGFGTAAAQPAIFALTIDRVGTENRGAAVSTFQASFDVAYTVGPVGLGQLAAVAGYPSIYLLAGVIVVFGLVLFVTVLARQGVPLRAPTPTI